MPALTLRAFGLSALLTTLLVLCTFYVQPGLQAKAPVTGIWLTPATFATVTLTCIGLIRPTARAIAMSGSVAVALLLLGVFGMFQATMAQAQETNMVSLMTTSLLDVFLNAAMIVWFLTISAAVGALTVWPNEPTTEPAV